MDSNFWSGFLCGVILIGFLALLVIAWLVNKIVQLKQPPKEPPRKFESRAGNLINLSQSHAVYVYGMTNQKWERTYEMLLKGEFTLENAKVVRIGQRTWGRVKKVLAGNGLITLVPNEPIAPLLPDQRRRIEALLVQVHRRISQEATRRVTLVHAAPEGEQLPESEGWIRLKR